MKKEYPDILKLEGEKWQNPDPATGKLGTRVPAEWLQTTEDSLKSLTLEMLEVLKAAGINPNELNNTQVRDAIKKIILNNATSTLSDRTDQTATIKAVNDVNRAASTAQKTANNAHALAQSKQDKLPFVGEGPDVMKTGAFGLGDGNIDQNIDIFNYKTSFLQQTNDLFPTTMRANIILHGYQRDRMSGILQTPTGNRAWLFNTATKAFDELYTENNTTWDKSGFLRISGSSDAITTTDLATTSKQGITRLDSSLSDAEDRAATPKSVNNVNRTASTAQKTANNAHALAQTKQDKLTFVGEGPDVMKTGAFGLGDGNIDQNIDIFNYKTSFLQQTNDLFPTTMRANIILHGYQRDRMSGILQTPTGNRAWLFNTATKAFDELYTENNTTWDKSGFLRKFGSQNALIESDIVNSLGNSKYFVASQNLVTEVDSRIKPNIASISKNGWWKCGYTGLIFQWGTVGSNKDPQESSFPISFPNACLNITGGQSNFGPTQNNFVIKALSSSSFSHNIFESAGTLQWFAIGY
ncbi:hypothetical protein GCM10007161_05390 [Ignatzschineria indica]|uniref:gp53-like domain-containing protein n=1 Tax=Ignatzschineria indica TaxID=472583 RepID=UPI000F0B1111|nr:tail fiber protein [Ignatzschineria indica]GGZ77165.1 hypothetical protein GCM10007161_05390 [Ignatzschineria indica]